jgi:hypothetical protein
MTKQEKHELRVKIARQLKLVQSSLSFMTEEDLVNLEEQLKKALEKAIS